MRSILVVDDNEDMRTLLTNLLVTNGFKVDLAQDSEIAFEILSRLKPDLILLDIRLPKLNGLEMLKRIKENNPEAKVILLTAYSSISSRNKAVEYGANDYVTKPFDNYELLNRINLLMGKES
ncbi:MAG: response regulator [Candidatus Cloacimonadales bacterium]